MVQKLIKNIEDIFRKNNDGQRIETVLELVLE